MNDYETTVEITVNVIRDYAEDISYGVGGVPEGHRNLVHENLKILASRMEIFPGEGTGQADALRYLCGVTMDHYHKVARLEWFFGKETVLMEIDKLGLMLAHRALVSV